MRTHFPGFRYLLVVTSLSYYTAPQPSRWGLTLSWVQRLVSCYPSHQLYHSLPGEDTLSWVQRLITSLTNNTTAFQPRTHFHGFRDLLPAVRPASPSIPQSSSWEDTFWVQGFSSKILSEDTKTTKKKDLHRRQGRGRRCCWGTEFIKFLAVLAVYHDHEWIHPFLHIILV